MSRLDDLLQDLAMGSAGVRKPLFTKTGKYSDYKDQIKDLMLELIGEDFGELSEDSAEKNLMDKALNDYRAELRKKVEEL